MAYCAIADVQEEMGTTFSTTSKPTTARVTAAIDEVAAILDGVLAAAGYTVPLTGASSLLKLKRINTYGACVTSWHSGIISNDLPVRVEFWQGQFDAFIQRVKDGTEIMPDDTPTATPNSSFSMNMKRVDGYSTWNPDGINGVTPRW